MKFIIGLLVIVVCQFDFLMAQTLKDEWVVVNDKGCKVLDPYYSEGITMKWDGACINGKANGFGKLTKYDDGKLESTFEGNYINGIREGKGTFSHKDGSVAKGNYVNGQLVGFGTRISENGDKYEGEFLNYREHGKGVYYYANGSKFEGFFVSDKAYTGKFTDYDEKITFIQKYYIVEEIKETKSTYNPPFGVKQTEYYDENWKRCKQKDALYYRVVTYESANKPRGVIKDYYINGQLQNEFTCPYVDYDDPGKNFHEGEATWYYKNGQIQEKRYYFNNKINGLNTYYYENGEKSKEIEYNHGKLNGDYVLYYPNGKIKLYALYEYGDLVDGKYVEYDENGMAALVYFENFEKNKSKWVDKDENYESFLNDQDNLEVKILKDRTFAFNNFISFDQKSNYSVETLFHKKTGKGNEGYGLIFGFKDWDNYYQFIISEYGSYMVQGKFEGMDINVIEWTKSSAINTGNQKNLLKIFKYDDEFIFSIRPKF